MAITFDGVAKRVQLPAGAVSLDLAYLYSRYKDWLISSGSGAPLAFDTVGGEIPAIPLYLFLKNGWRIIPQAANHTLTVAGGILEVAEGGDPFVDPAGNYKIRINRQTPGIAIGYSTSGGSQGPTAESIADAVWSKALP